MNQYVVILSVGPVQTFIASARRSRDLWSGSWLLSELAKACAKSLYDDQAMLIFPTVQNPEQDLADNSEFSVGNKIQVIVKADNPSAIVEIVKKAKQAVQDRFHREAIKSLGELVKFKNIVIRDDIWSAQISDYVEVQAAWAKFSDNDYSDAVNRAGSLLATRKATRDFKASPATSARDSKFMLPKSSLDGARETVLPKEFDRKSTMARKLSLSDGEQLDSAGLIKRLGGNVDQFTPYTRVAAHQWLENLNDEEAESLGEAYETLVKLGLATRVSGNKGCYAKFPYDGESLYSFRIEAVLQKYRKDPEALDAYKYLQKTLKPLWKKYGEPCRYSALLLADGDRMGELLDKATTVEAHQTITLALSRFASSVEDIMREFKGHRIYAGGDDILGFVPLDQAYDCAKALAKQFEKALSGGAKELGADNPPTLSVGLAITHIMTPLGHIRSLAQRAEKKAKGDHEKIYQQRNALGITLAVRSGSTTDMRLRWDDEKAHQAFHDWVQYYSEGLLTSRVAYDTREVYLRTNFLVKDTPDEKILLGNIRTAEFKRMLKQSQTASGKEIPKEIITQLENRLKYLNGFKESEENNVEPLDLKDCRFDFNGMDDLATELIIARWLSVKTQKDLGRI